jgi:hypothetical protein
VRLKGLDNLEKSGHLIRFQRQVIRDEKCDSETMWVMKDGFE